MIPIIPAIIPISRAELIELTQALQFSHELHLDLVDGIFVGTASWPFAATAMRDELLSMKPHTDAFTLEVDLMVTDPIPLARQLIEAGADMLVFHIETVDLASFNDFVLHVPKDVSVGVSFNGATTVEAVLPYLLKADYVQVMGIHTIGVQGQPFDEAVFSKIRAIKEAAPDCVISVDGSVNESNAARLVKAGANRLIVGSAIVKQADMAAAYESLSVAVYEAM